ncbi:hypothetical protein NLJ89_g3841 [Agrocybe chaxingu]|uniref:Uncharacterized protein n=1 Tax=Agrocybe chaxingu TaxID=84603 RepID=A0A9W8MY43_9AGAR|nr:hypothetical protein NLJ89_g3841 [Agrocybe chaxingu]
MFDSSRNVGISGGQFVAQHGPVSNRYVTVYNYNQNISNPRRSGREDRRIPPEQNTIRPIRRSNVLYEQHLMHNGRGYPLWIPQPNIRLPIPYRAKGVSIGDVGIITAYGAFDFLFNAHVEPNEYSGIFGNSRLEVTWRALQCRRYNREWIPCKGYTFESSASEGAILAMLEGAYHEELGNVSRFREYIAVHAENWYKFVNVPRGREAQNGDVRLVIGSDKTTGWGMATFSSTTEEQSNVRLQFSALGGRGQQSSGPMYTWEHLGSAEARVGPDASENEELGATAARPLRNQCLFMRTLSVTLAEETWKRLRSENFETETGSSSSATTDCQSSNPPTGQSGGSSGMPYSNIVASSGGRQGSSSLPNDSEPTPNTNVIVEHSSTAPYTIHLSKFINDFLLQEVPHAKMAIASDRDWHWVLLSELQLYEPAEFISQICSFNVVSEHNGLAFLEPLDHTEETWSQELDEMDSIQARRPFLFDLIDGLNSSFPPHLSFHDPADQIKLACLPRHPNRLLTIDEILDLRGTLRMDVILNESMSSLRRQLDLLPQAHTDRPKVMRKLAHSLLKRFSLRDDLDESIWYLQHALKLKFDYEYQRLEVLLHLSSALFQRIQLLGQRQDITELFACLQQQLAIDFDHALRSVKKRLENLPPLPEPKATNQDIFLCFPKRWGNNLRPVPDSRVGMLLWFTGFAIATTGPAGSESPQNASQTISSRPE